MSTRRNWGARRIGIAGGALAVVVAVIAVTAVGVSADQAISGAQHPGENHLTDTTAFGANAVDDSIDDDRWSGVQWLTDADIEALRTATAPYADPAVAVEAGRVDLELCYDQMGYHFADPATFADGVLDPADPEAFVYADVDGTTRLVAVEWVSRSPGEVLGIPLHLNHDLDLWVLHAWIGLDNPWGMLADHNPDVGDCEAA